MKNIRAVVLDADNTLFSVHPSVGVVYSRFCAKYGITAPAEQIDALLDDAWENFKHDYQNRENGYTTSQQREKEKWKELSSTIIGNFGTTPQLDELFEELYEEFARARSRVLFDGVLEFVMHVRSKGIGVSVLSNNDERLPRLLDDMTITHHFDHILPTTQIGFKKPSARCFELVAERIGIEPNTILHIGDDIDNDYHAPREAGWQAFWFNPERKALPVGDIQAISSYQELTKLFEV